MAPWFSHAARLLDLPPGPTRSWGWWSHHPRGRMKLPFRNPRRQGRRPKGGRSCGSGPPVDPCFPEGIRQRGRGGGLAVTSKSPGSPGPCRCGTLEGDGPTYSGNWVGGVARRLTHIGSVPMAQAAPPRVSRVEEDQCEGNQGVHSWTDGSARH